MLSKIILLILESTFNSLQSCSSKTFQLSCLLEIFDYHRKFQKTGYDIYLAPQSLYLRVFLLRMFFKLSPFLVLYIINSWCISGFKCFSQCCYSITNYPGLSSSNSKHIFLTFREAWESKIIELIDAVCGEVVCRWLIFYCILVAESRGGGMSSLSFLWKPYQGGSAFMNWLPPKGLISKSPFTSGIMISTYEFAVSRETRSFSL